MVSRTLCVLEPCVGLFIACHICNTALNTEGLLDIWHIFYQIRSSKYSGLMNEPVHEKTNNLGSPPGLTQTGLYSHRRRLKLEILDLDSRGIVLSV